MDFKEFIDGKKCLINPDNNEWIDKINCWKYNELSHNIYVFQVNVIDQDDLLRCYESITASIATDFQSTLEKNIEKWNIYLIFVCDNKISSDVKAKIEHDKYSTRKLVWDSNEQSYESFGEYIKKRLFDLNIKKEDLRIYDEISIMDKVRLIDIELYNAIEDDNLEKQLEVYLGEAFYE